LQQKGFGEKHAHPRRIQPGGGAGIADEGDGPAHAELVKQIAQLSRAARQGIDAGDASGLCALRECFG